MRKLLLLVIATIFGSMTIMATPDTLISKVYYDLVDSSLTAFVTHDGDFSDGAGYSGNVTIPATIKVGANVYTVVGVSDNAFYNCDKVKKVTIGSNVASIGADVFYGCSSLETIVWKAKTYADAEVSPFAKIDGLKNIEIDGAKYIPTNFCKDLELKSLIVETMKSDSLVVGTDAFKFKSAESVEWMVPTCADFAECPFGPIQNFYFWEKSAQANTAAVVPAYLCAGLDIETLLVTNNIVGIGANAFAGCKNLKEVKWDAKSCADFESTPFENLEKITFNGAWVERIPAALCKGTAIESVNIAGKKGVKFSIGEDAFEGCENLKMVVWSVGDCNDFDGVSPFPLLDTISFGADVKYIPAYLCNGQSKLTKIKIAKNVEAIGEKAFVGCKSLVAFEVDPQNEKFSAMEGALYAMENKIPTTFVCCPTGNKSINVAEGTITIEAGSFNGCDKLASVTVPHSVKYIKEKALHETLWFAEQKDGYVYVDNKLYSYKGTMPENEKVIVKDGTVIVYNDALSGHSSYVSMTIPESVIFIGENAFAGSKKLNDLTWNAINCEDFLAIPFGGMKSVTFGGKVENLPAHLCENANVETVSVPASVKRIGDQAFANCSYLKSVDIADGGNMEIGDYSFMNCQNMTSMQLPKDLVKIGRFAFSHCSSLVTLSLPTTLSEIGEQAFYNCSSLKSIVLPSAITTIAPFTFHNCTSLKSVTLGEKMESLCYNAFTNTNLDTITSYAVVPPLVYGVDGLYEIEGTDTVPAQQYDLFTVESQVCILRVYKESIAAYKANEAWGKFVNIMPISATGNAPSNNQLDNMFAVDGQLYLDGVGAYKVYDTTGQLIYEGSNPVLNLSKGIYIIVAGDQTKKIVL